jgi:hypothetical protein
MRMSALLVASTWLPIGVTACVSAEIATSLLEVLSFEMQWVSIIA